LAPAREGDHTPGIQRPGFTGSRRLEIGEVFSRLWRVISQYWFLRKVEGCANQKELNDMTTAISEKGGVIVTPHEPSDSPDREMFKSLLREHGLVLAREFSITLEQFYRFTDQVAGGLHRDVVETHHELFYHGEAYWQPDHPDVLWFYCEQPAKQGGETKFCDGIQVARKLSDRTRKYFSENDLIFDATLMPEFYRGYMHCSGPEQAVAWLANNLKLDSQIDGDRILTTYAHKALHTTRWGEKDAFVNTLLHALDPVMSMQQLYRLRTRVPEEILSEVREVTEKLTILVPWQTNDFVAVDNSRFMHGRNAFQGERHIFAVNGYLPSEG
jgi:hypothetical protein